MPSFELCDPLRPPPEVHGDAASIKASCQAMGMPEAFWPKAEFVSVPGATPPARTYDSFRFMQPVDHSGGSPFLRLPIEIRSRIIEFLTPTDVVQIARTCQSLSKLAHRSALRKIDIRAWTHLLPFLASPITPTWLTDSLKFCRSLALTVQCPAALPGGETSTRKALSLPYAHNDQERKSISRVCTGTLSNVARQVEKLESLTFRFDSTPAILDELFSAVSTGHLRSLTLADVCSRRAVYTPTDMFTRRGGVVLMQCQGWDKLQNLQSLATLDLTSIIYIQASLALTSRGLNSLLERCPGLVNLRIHLAADDSNHPGWVTLTRLETLSWANLRVLDLERVAAPSEEITLSFLRRHQGLVHLRWLGTTYGGKTQEEMTAKLGSVGSQVQGAGTFGVHSGVHILLPDLKSLCVSSARLSNAILALSAPEDVQYVQWDLRPEPFLPERVHLFGTYKQFRFNEEDPMPAIKACTSLLEVSLIFYGSASESSRNEQLASVISQLPSTLIVLTVQTHDVVNPADEKQEPLCLPTAAFAHLKSLRALFLPQEALFLACQAKLLRENALDAREKWLAYEGRARDTRARALRIGRDFARLLPSLDSLCFVDPRGLDSVNLPKCQLESAGDPRKHHFFSMHVTRLHEEDLVLPSPVELQRIKTMDRLGAHIWYYAVTPQLRRNCLLAEKEWMRSVGGRARPDSQQQQGAYETMDRLVDEKLEITLVSEACVCLRCLLQDDEGYQCPTFRAPMPSSVAPITYAIVPSGLIP